MVNTGKLEAKIDSLGIKKSYISEVLGITPQTLYNKINNFTEFSVSELMYLAKVLNITSMRELESIFFNTKVS